MTTISNFLRRPMVIVSALVILFAAFSYSVGMVYAWTGPTAAPTGNNVAAPINVGSTSQVKDGALSVNSFIVFGNSLFGGSAGSNAYLNFGATSGYDGYGIRDNAGTMEFKNYGGSWQSIQDILYALCGGPCGGSSTPASGTLCGMKDTVRAELTTCMGYNPASSCPSGYTKKVMFAFQDNDVAYTHIIYSCVAN